MANLTGANLRHADFSAANFSMTNLSGANLSEADFNKADLTGANLSGANLSWAKLIGANLCGADLHGTNLMNARCDGTVFGNVILSAAIGVDAICHIGPSVVGIDTLSKSKGQIPEEFLLRCCLAPWAVVQARMYDPTLTQHEISELQHKVFEQRSLCCPSDQKND